MKKFLSIIILFFWSLGNAQLDTEHWFAPMGSRAGTGNLESYIYLSTNETTPFPVQIYNNNTLYNTITISKGNPAEVAIPGTFMIAEDTSQMFTPINKGLNLKASKKFYANYRFAVTNHAEIITSKGFAGLGTTFYAAMAANTTSASYVNSTIGVIATEDNTVVTFSGYDPAIIFSDGTSSPTKTVTLNKGQSYVLDVMSDMSQNNLAGLIGAKIEATRPISVTNGNFNAIYTQFNFSNNDIVMDQSVPVERLGKDFAVVKGNGPATSGMEAVLVIATENNTTINVNGAPFGGVLNAGQYALIQGTNYINQGNEHYNIGIQTNKNVYVYQLLAGTSTGNVYPSGGFNYIPPLSCFLPNKVDEIGFINKLGSTFYQTKLNIITQAGATVTVNGTAMPANSGPYPVTGNPNWVTYSLSNVSGNVTVNSTKSVTAGIAAGSGAVGYGGYFAGFSSVPVIVKTGDCYTGIKLEVDNSYDAYQWYLNGNPIPGATTYFINPELYGAGNYTVMVTKNNCESKMTLPYNYTLCPPITTIIYNIGSCNNLVFTPAFSTSTQTIDPTKTVILGQPSQGTVTVNSTTGQITYTPNTTITADTTDFFVYYIEGTGNPADFEYIKALINIDVLQTTNAALVGCANANGVGLFDLTSVSLSPDAGVTYTYYTDAALTNQINNPTAYSSAAGTVFVKVKSAFNCYKNAQINLSLTPSPNINTSSYNSALCDENFDGTINVDFSTITTQIVTNPANFNVRYYLNQSDATAGNNNTLPNLWSYNTATTVYVRVDALVGSCPSVFGQINFSIGNKIPLLTQDYTAYVCDTGNNGTEQIDLNTFKSNFTTNPAVTLSFFSNLADAQNNVNPINNLQTINTSGVYYIRFQSTPACPNVAKITLILDTINVTNTTLSSCANNAGNGTFNLTNAQVTTNTGITINYFADAGLTQPINNPNNYQAIASTVYAQITTANNCTAVAQITLIVHPLPNINTANFNASLCDDNFDGIVAVNFSTITPQIVNGSASFNVRYYLSAADATAGNNNNLPNNWTYTATTTVYVRVDSIVGNCTPAFGQITFTIGNRIVLITQNASAEVCDNDLNGTESVNLQNYKNLFTLDPAVNLSFYNALANAQNGTNPITNTQNITGPTQFFVRFQSNTACPNTAQLNLNIKTPKSSATLQNQTICGEKTTVLDAGPGFTSYLWNTGATTQSITVPVGNYYVDLGFNGCVYRQQVTVSAVENPVINSIDVNGTTATINVTGGNPPYQYSLDGTVYQSSNTFTGLKRGVYTAFVISADNCKPVTKEFLVVGLINVITPNGDGINDVLDYSDFSIKENVVIEIYDRYGSLLHRSSEGNYKWDGTIKGRPLSTGTYWYIIKWIEPDTKATTSYSNWIMLKNRD